LRREPGHTLFARIAAVGLAAVLVGAGALLVAIAESLRSSSAYADTSPSKLYCTTGRW